MMNRAPIILLVLLSCVQCFGQSSFKGLQPGRSPRTEVEKVLGPPLNEVSATLLEYKSDQESEKIFVQYRRDSSVVERIEAVYPEAIDRSAVERSLNLRQPSASQTNARGKLEEYFSTADVVLTYAGAEITGGVSSVGYYSRELFESAAANVPRTQPNTPAQGGAPGRTQNGASSASLTLPPRPLPQTSGPSISVDRSGRASTSTGSASDSDEPQRTQTTKTRSYPSAAGRPPITMTTRSSPAGTSEPSSSKDPLVFLGTTDPEAAEKEISMSGEELRKFVGRYEFTQSNIPSLTAATLRLVGGKLKVTIGATTYTLVPIASDALEVFDQDKSDSAYFKIVGKPGAKIHFVMSGGKVETLFYTEEVGEEMRFAVAAPKP